LQGRTSSFTKWLSTPFVSNCRGGFPRLICFKLLSEFYVGLRNFKLNWGKLKHIIYTLNLTDFHCEYSVHFENKLSIYLPEYYIYSINILDGHDIQMQKWIYIDDCTIYLLSRKNILVNRGPMQGWTSSFSKWLSTLFVSSCRGGFPCLICFKLLSEFYAGLRNFT
jgi:hypothetical protein